MVVVLVENGETPNTGVADVVAVPKAGAGAVAKGDTAVGVVRVPASVVGAAVDAKAAVAAGDAEPKLAEDTGVTEDVTIVGAAVEAVATVIEVTAVLPTPKLVLAAPKILAPVEPNIGVDPSEAVVPKRDCPAKVG